MSQRKGAKRDRRGGALVLIAMLLTCSAIVRLGFEAAPAFASASFSTEQRENDNNDRSSTSPEDLHTLLAEFRKREERIRQKEAEIDERMTALQLVNSEVDRKIGELTRAEEDLRSTLALADGAAEDDLARLSVMYQKMKPKEAAALFEEMAPEFAAGFLARMPSETAAGIMENLSPKSAYTVSVVLAGRNATVPQE
ncbi:MotE family protein [Primorskyibacter sp. S87]|uniref:MotE family protein n=1 Tax=Primorskyibacter sp. S87 TaxID=3415126 RepID=UPI003C7A965C